MKQLIKVLIALGMATIMACSIVPVAAAEEAISVESKVISVITESDGSKAYELAWKYKKENGHYYKRRWNLTLNAWYDPAWILVY